MRISILDGMTWNNSLFALVAAIAVVASSSTYAQQSVTFASWGGALSDAESKAWVQPAAKKLGFKINMETHGGSYANIKAQVASGKVTYDVVAMGAAECARAVAEGTAEKIDLSLVPNAADLPKTPYSEYCLTAFSFSTVIAWNKDKFGDRGPTSWAEFWDTKKFPGARSMRGYTRATLEAALLADGVSKKDLYPLDVDRAFRKLEQLKPSVAVWWASGAQSTQLLANGEVDLMAIWNGRVEAAIKEGAHVKYSYSDGILEFETLFIPKGSSNKEAAMRVINEFLSPESQAGLSTLIDYGPANPKAFQTSILQADRAKSLPTHPENSKLQTLLNPEWYATSENEKAVARWSSFVQK